MYYYRDTEDSPSTREPSQCSPREQDPIESTRLLCQVGHSDNQPANERWYTTQHQCQLAT